MSRQRWLSRASVQTSATPSRRQMRRSCSCTAGSTPANRQRPSASFLPPVPVLHRIPYANDRDGGHDRQAGAVASGDARWIVGSHLAAEARRLRVDRAGGAGLVERTSRSCGEILLRRVDLYQGFRAAEGSAAREAVAVGSRQGRRSRRGRREWQAHRHRMARALSSRHRKCNQARRQSNRDSCCESVGSIAWSAMLSRVRRRRPSPQGLPTVPMPRCVPRA